MFNSRIAFFAFLTDFFPFLSTVLRLQLPQMPAFSKAGPGSGRNAETTPQQAVGRRATRGAEPRQLSFPCKRFVQTEGLFLEQAPLTSADTFWKGEHHSTLLSSPAFLKVPSISETLSFAEYIAFCLLVLQTISLLSPPCFYVVLL